RTSRTADEKAWIAALGALPALRQARIEQELEQVNELAGSEGMAHLLEAAKGGELPPDSVPAGAAVALWFLLRRPELFREVYFHHEVSGLRLWHAGHSTPGLATAALPRPPAPLAT